MRTCCLLVVLTLTQSLAAQPPRLDHDGNSLPEGALLRIGTTRLRSSGTPQSLAFTPDGARLVTIDLGSGIHVWDVASGKELLALGRIASSGGCIAVAEDGSLAALVEAADVCQLYDTKAGQALRAIKAEWTRTRTLRFSPDNKLLAAADEDMVVRLWDVATGALVRRWELNNIEVYVREPQLAFAPDGKLLALGSRAGCIYLCNVASGQIVEMGDKPGGYGALAFSPNGKVLAVVEPGFKRCTLWDVGMRQPLCSLQEDGAPYWSVAFTPDGKELATGSWPGKVCIWNIATGKLQRGIPGQRGEVDSLAFSRDGKRLATGSGGCTVRIWDFAAGNQLQAFAGPHASLVHARFTTDGKAIISYSNPWYSFKSAVGSTVRLLDPATGLALRQIDFDPEETSAWCLAPDRSLVAVVAKDGTLRLHNFATGKDVPALKPPDWPIQALTLSPDSRFLLAVAQKPVQNPNGLVASTIRQSFHVWNTADGSMVFSDLGKEGYKLYCHFTLDGCYLAVQSIGHGNLVGINRENPKLRNADGSSQASDSVTLWDVRTGQKARRAGPPLAAGSLATFSPTGRWFAELHEAGQPITIRETATGKTLKRQTVGGVCNCLTISPDGRLMALGTDHGTILLWDMVSATQEAVFSGHRGKVLSLSFAPDGKRLLSCGDDTIMFVWDTARLTTGSAKAKLPLAPADAAKLWDALASDDAETAYAAVYRLVQSPRESVALLRQRLRWDPTDDTRDIAKWIADLDSNRFAEREQAMARLRKLGNLALPALERALAGNPSLEVRQRVLLLVAKIEFDPLPAAWLRALRALEVLEMTATPDAVELLESLARGEADGWLTLEAAASLERVGQRGKQRGRMQGAASTIVIVGHI